MKISRDTRIPLKKRIIYYLADRWLRGDTYFFENYGPVSVKGGRNGR